MQLISDDLNTDLSSRRTSMSFQRTRMAADRTLMAVIRTALSMISFGFTIHQLAQKLREKGLLPSDVAERNFGAGLILMGLAILALGIIYHLNFMRHMRVERKQMVAEKLLHPDWKYPVSFTLVTAVLLFAFGVAVIISFVV